MTELNNISEEERISIKTEQPFISVIIPVYNVEKYLEQCVNSVIKQSFDNIEVILVDDGSPDSCPAICDKYAELDKRVSVIHKENGGLSDARNAGINAAVGKYLLFIDSDDFIAEGSFEKIAETVFNDGRKDIMILNGFYLYPDGTKTVYGLHFTKKNFLRKNKKDVLEYLTTISLFHVSACIKLVERDFIIRNSLFFTKGLICEDVDWSIKLYLHSESFGCCEFPYYYYRQEREGSILYTFTEKMYADVLHIISKWLKAAENEYKEYRYSIYLFVEHLYYSLVYLYNDKSNKNRAKYKYELKKHSWLLGASRSNKAKLISIFYKLFGMRMLSFTLNLIKKWRFAGE